MMMIKCNLRELRARKETRDGIKLPYRTLAKELGLSLGTVSRLINNDFDRVETPTLTALCKYFECGIGDLLEYIPDAP